MTRIQNRFKVMCIRRFWKTLNVSLQSKRQNLLIRTTAGIDSFFGEIGDYVIRIVDTLLRGLDSYKPQPIIHHLSQFITTLTNVLEQIVSTNFISAELGFKGCLLSLLGAIFQNYDSNVSPLNIPQPPGIIRFVKLLFTSNFIANHFLTFLISSLEVTVPHDDKRYTSDCWLTATVIEALFGLAAMSPEIK